MGFITPHQVDHVLEYGTVVPGQVKTVGGGLRLIGEKTNRSVLKKFEFTDEVIFVRSIEKKDYTLIIDILVKYKRDMDTDKC